MGFEYRITYVQFCQAVFHKAYKSKTEVPLNRPDMEGRWLRTIVTKIDEMMDKPHMLSRWVGVRFRNTGIQTVDEAGVKEMIKDKFYNAVAQVSNGSILNIEQ